MSRLHLYIAWIYFREDDGHQRNSVWIMFSLWQMLTMWAKKLPLPQLLTKLDQQDVKKETAKLCQDKVLTQERAWYFFLASREPQLIIFLSILENKSTQSHTSPFPGHS
ncbi:hypothetical protein LEMLEM_LOCUS9110 [Lemmus lemmus]